MSYDACFHTLPIIETERLILRQITNSENDGRDCLEFINDYNVYRYWGLYDEAKDINGKNKPKQRHKLDYHYKTTLKEYTAGRELSWLMELKDTNKVIGEFVLYDFHLKKQADIGYRINSNYWGQGFASEAGQALLKVGFDFMQLHRIQLRCFKENVGSKRVAEKLGFTQEGYIKQGAILNVITDFYIFGYLKDDYETNKINNQNIKIHLSPDLIAASIV